MEQDEIPQEAEAKGSPPTSQNDQPDSAGRPRNSQQKTNNPLNEPSGRPKGSSPWIVLLAGFLGAIFGVVVGGLMTACLVRDVIPFTTSGVGRGGDNSLVQPLKPAKDLVADVAKKVSPAVVNIRSSFKGADRFHDGLELKGQGSGVIFRTDGFILTNAHVVEEAKGIYVTLPSGKDIRGSVVGIDADNDIAVVKINAKGLPTATFGRSRDLRVGELAVAIGSPFGLEHSVTSGVVSALHRNVSAGDDQRLKTLTNLIQTDAPINPGNSGGALTNYEGKVIGINTLIFTTNGSGQGIGFAIPSEFALEIANQIINKGKTVHPYIGVCIGNLDEVVARGMNLSVTKGALITRILPRSPAGKGGLRTDDVVIRAGSFPVTSAEDLIAAVRAQKVGDKLALVVLRNGKKRQISITLASKPDDKGSMCAEVTDEPQGGTPDRGERTPPGHP